jgi:hypothetical protein
MGTAEHGLRPIGHSLPKIGPMPRSVTSTSSSSSQNSGITTAPRSAFEVAAPIGPRHGGSGAIAPAPASSAHDNPETPDRSVVVSCPASVAAALRPVYRPIYRENEKTGEVEPTGDFDFVAFEALPTLAHAPVHDLQTARSLVARALAPADKNRVKEALAQLRSLTLHQTSTPMEAAFTASTFETALAKYPADIVVWACGKWANTHDWWPPWNRLKDLIERAVERREILLHRLNSASVPKPAATEKAADDVVRENFRALPRADLTTAELALARASVDEIMQRWRPRGTAAQLASAPEVSAPARQLRQAARARKALRRDAALLRGDPDRKCAARRSPGDAARPDPPALCRSETKAEEPNASATPRRRSRRRAGGAGNSRSRSQRG